MPRNLEIKARIESVEKVLAIVRQIGAEYKAELLQTDTYFCVQVGRLKLREIGNDHSELIYYERGEETSQRMSNYEIYHANDPSSLKRILGQSVGIKDIVRKKRILFMLDVTRIHIDEVTRLGSFLEIEMPLDATTTDAGERMNHLTRALQIREADYIFQSYIDLLLAGKRS